MNVATTLATGYSRTVPLHDSDKHQSCREIEIGDVPEMPHTAVVADVTPRTVRYEDGPHTWFVDPRDKTVIRAYRKRRNQQEIEAGAFPTIAFFYDGKGPL